MKKIVLIIIIFVIPIEVVALDYPKLNSNVVEIYDLTDNKVVYEKNSSKKNNLASITKIATVLTSIESIKDVSKEVIITRDILNTVVPEASKAGLKQGDKVTYEDLLYCSMLPSGADCTNSLAILISGNIEKFVDKMNNLVKKIGLTNTHFVNVTGLDVKNHYSTASDIRKLLVHALKNPLFKKIYTTKKYKLTNGLKIETTLYKYNTSQLDISKILGSKTGYTKEAGYCLASLDLINEHEIIIIVLNAKHIGNNYYNIVDTNKLINFISNNYKDEVLVKKDSLIKEITVNLSDIDNYEIKSTVDVSKFLPKDYDKNKIKIDYVGLNELSYRNKKGSKIGVINYYFEDELIYKENVVLDKKINLNIIKLIKKYIVLIIVGIVVIFVIIKKKRK